MRIDLHCHTRATKKGESLGRNVDKKTFIETIQDRQVKIVAITNHNLFDFNQYNEFLNNDFQVWPGIELDIFGETSKGHCVLVANPLKVVEFDNLVKTIVGTATADTFSISVVDLCSKIKAYQLIVIPHYGNKKPSLSDEDIGKLKEQLSVETAFFLEPQNLRSAGVYCAHDMNAIVGSDHHHWSTYPGEGKELPELKLPIDNFDKFFLLIKKDPQVIKTFLNQKLYGEMVIQPFSDFNFRQEIYNDINVFFGGKGTGKTEILKAFQRQFEQSGNADVAKYYASEKKTTYDDMTALAIKDGDFKSLGIEKNEDSFSFFTDWTEKKVATTRKYYAWAKAKDIETTSRNFGFINAGFSEVIDDTPFNQAFAFYAKNNPKITDLITEDFSRYLSFDDSKKLKESLLSLKQAIISDVINKFCAFKALTLEKKTIDAMKEIFTSKKGIETRPSGTGLLEQYGNCIATEYKSSKIFQALNTAPNKTFELLGSLIDKGNIFQMKTIVVNPDLTNSEFVFKIGKSKIQKLRDLKKMVETINKDAFSEKAKESISAFNRLASSESIKSIEDFLAVFSKTVKEDKVTPYNPSNGEQSMLVLDHALLDDSKKIFILDEPEMSVGHKYINQVIVPRLKELARKNKVVIVSTHDANIAIRTLPFLSVYREDLGAGKYATYIGSPFLDLMKNYDNPSNTIGWAKTSIDTLEGGKEAFNERGEAYGKERV